MTKRSGTNSTISKVRRTRVETIEEDGTRVEAYVYLWAGSGDALSNGEWDFTYFERQRLED